MSPAFFHLTSGTSILAFLKFVVNSSPCPPPLPRSPFPLFPSQDKNVGYGKYVLGAILDKYKNLIEYSRQLSVETKHGVAMDTGCLASALTH